MCYTGPSEDYPLPSEKLQMKPVLCLYYSTMKFGVIIIRSGSPMLIVEKNFNQGSFSLFSQNLEKVKKNLDDLLFPWRGN